MIRRRLLLIAVAACALATLLAGPAWAHKPSDSYLALTVDPAGGSVRGQWDIALRDLEQAVGLDADADGAITWGELKGRHEAVAAYALARLGVEADGAACGLSPTGHLVATHGDGAYAVLRFAAACPAGFREFSLAYRLLFDIDPLHRGLLRVADRESTHTAVLSPDVPRFRLTASAPPDLVAQALGYGWQGAWHIWIGFDHILFLLSLLLPAVLRRRDGRWQAVGTFREAVLEVLKVVTAFTVAHSVTLSLATLGLVAVPSHLVESVIAASVVLAALNNIFPLVDRRLWLAAFGFGLVHGLGFAGALEELGLPQGALAVSLAAFNVGVELGQLAIVAAFLPVAFALRRTALYPRLVLRAGSGAIALVAGAWFVERAFDIVLL